MTLTTLEQRTGELSGHIEEIVDDLRRLKADLRRVQGLVQDGDATGVKEALRTAGDVRTFLKIAYEVEAKLNDERRREEGGGAGCLDLGAARAEIGCKLDRLRRCCGAGPVPG